MRHNLMQSGVVLCVLFSLASTLFGCTGERELRAAAEARKQADEWAKSEDPAFGKYYSDMYRASAESHMEEANRLSIFHILFSEIFGDDKHDDKVTIPRDPTW